MASLLTSAEKTAINSALSDIHDTFARDIHVYVKEASSVPAELNYNPLYGRTKNTAKYLRLDSRSNGVSYVSSEFYFGGKVALKSQWAVNCKENVMLNELGTEWIKIRGIWRSQKDNVAATDNVAELYDFACSS